MPVRSRSFSRFPSDIGLYNQPSGSDAPACRPKSEDSEAFSSHFCDEFIGPRQILNRGCDLLRPSLAFGCRAKTCTDDIDAGAGKPPNQLLNERPRFRRDPSFRTSTRFADAALPVPLWGGGHHRYAFGEGREIAFGH